jgi:hypothetical protein
LWTLLLVQYLSFLPAHAVFVPAPEPDACHMFCICLMLQVPTTVEFVDIAGLVRGASKGEGLGNKFLANIRETDAICQVRLLRGLLDMAAWDSVTAAAEAAAAAAAAAA